MFRVVTTIFLICIVFKTEARAGDTAARMRGDFVIGGLFSVHKPPRGDQGALECGAIREIYGIQRIETALRVLDEINNSTEVLRGVTLGLEARDSCWSAPVALQQSLELIRDAMIAPASKPDIQHNVSSSCLMPDTQVSLKAPLIGVVGPGSSSVALQVQNLLQLFSIPQIGYSATSRDLSDKTRYSTFLRVVPSDYYQAQLLVDLVRYFNWTYVSIVNTDENYGTSGIQAFRELAEKNGVCVAREDSVLSTAEDSAFDSVIANLHQDKAANVVVCFCEGMTMRGLLGATKRMNLTGRFVFIGSDGWADRDEVVQSLENEAWGSLSIRIHSPYIYDFDSYYFSLNPFNNSRNPWFTEFWQTRFNCVMPWTPENEQILPLELGKTSDIELPNCTGEESLKHDRYNQDPKMSFIMKSFWTVAHGLHKMLQDVCGINYMGACNEMYPFNGSLFKRYLWNVSFKFLDDDSVHFDKRGDPPGRYEILNYQLMSNGTYAYVQIGDWNNGILKFSKFPQSRNSILTESVCSKPCPPGFYKNFKTGGQEKRCCWACAACSHYQYTNTKQMECIDCENGTLPNRNKTACEKIPEEYSSWADTGAITAMTSSVIGLVATFVTCHIFIRHNNTPVVKASTRDLSYLILGGMTLAHISVFAILMKPTLITCTISRMMPGISFAMIYASLFTKTNRIARILAGSKKRFPKRKLRFMSTTAQIAITCVLILIEVAVTTTTLLMEHAKPIVEYPARHRAVLTCATSPRAVLSPLAFDALLIGLCTLYAVKTRNVPENFNEAKFIGFAMYTTCVIWIAFVPIYFGSETKVVTMCMCVTLSASVTLIFLFLPKLYIIVLRPERNNRALFTTSKSIRCHIGARVAAAIAEPPTKQAIYGFSTSDDAESSGYRCSIQRRTLSVQTGAELICSCKFSSANDTKALPEKKDIETIYKCNENGRNSNGCVQNSNFACDKVANSIKNLATSETSLEIEKNYRNGKVHGEDSQLELSQWAELDVKSLIDDLRKKSPSPVSGCSDCSQLNHHCGSLVNEKINGSARNENYTYDPEVKSMTNDCWDGRLMGLTARIREENDYQSGTDDPVINITITLDTNMSEYLDSNMSGYRDRHSSV